MDGSWEVWILGAWLTWCPRGRFPGSPLEGAGAKPLGVSGGVASGHPGEQRTENREQNAPDGATEKGAVRNPKGFGVKP